MGACFSSDANGAPAGASRKRKGSMFGYPENFDALYSVRRARASST